MNRKEKGRFLNPRSSLKRTPRLRHWNVSAGNRQRVLISWREFKRKSRSGSACGIRNWKKELATGPATKMWKRPKFSSPFLGWGPERSFTPRREYVRTDSASKHMLELQKKTRKIIQCLYLLPLFSRRFIYFCLAKEVDSISYSLSFFSTTTKMCSSE